MIDLELQRDCFDVLRANPLINPQRLYVPELIPATDLWNQDVLDDWLSGIAQKWSDAFSDQEHIVHNVPNMIAGLTHDFELRLLNLSNVGYFNDDPPFTPKSFEEFFLVWASTLNRREMTNVQLGPNTIEGYDLEVRHSVMYEHSDIPVIFKYDLNTEVIRKIKDGTGLSSLGHYTPQFHDKYQRFLAQTDTLFHGQGPEGGNFAKALPYLALSYLSFKDTLTVDGLEFSASVDYEGRSEVVPIIKEVEANKAKAVEKIDISTLMYDLLLNEAEPAEIIGSGIIEGKVRVFDSNRMVLVPEGSIVLINDESWLSRVSPTELMVRLSGASAIVSRGYRGLDEQSRRLAGPNKDYSHSKIVARSLAQEKPGNFIWCQLPHLNPNDEESKIWEQLMRSRRACVASDGKDLKIRAL